MCGIWPYGINEYTYIHFLKSIKKKIKSKKIHSRNSHLMKKTVSCL